MKTALKNNSWITTIAFALIEFPIIIFLSYFSLGSKDDIMEIYRSDPSRIIFIRGCISFVITSFAILYFFNYSRIQLASAIGTIGSVAI